MNLFPLPRPVGRLAALALGLALITDAAAQLTQQRSSTSGSRSRSGAQSRQYRSSTMLGDAVIQVDQETRSLVIITDDDTNDEIGRVIKGLDQPKPQVLIKVLFLEVTRRNNLDLGIEGNYTYKHQGIQSGTVETIWGLAQQTDGGFWRVMSDDWEATLRAIALTGKTEVLSRPSILARNNQEAVIVVGEEVPIVSNSRITDQGQTINTLQYVEVGIILRVTPFITAEGLVEMIIAPEISNLTDKEVPITDTVGSPVIAKRSAETVVVTPNAKTVIIGGLMASEKTEVVRKVPVLGDVPLLGLAFRRTVTEDIKKELLIFLTPYIIETPSALESASRREVRQSEMAPTAFPPEKVQRFLEGKSLDEPEPEPAPEENPE